jgi:hypothetical protein
MKFRVSMKDPDTLRDAIEEAVNDSLSGSGLDRDEQEALKQLRTEKVYAQCSTWFQHGEYLEVVIDTDAATCTVITQKG